jgi:excisionase family DNA binding protein
MPTLNEPLAPTEKDVLLARASQRQIGGMTFGRRQSVKLEIDGKLTSIPVGLARLLIEAITRMAEGKSIAVVPLDDEISPQEAAEILSVSRPFATMLFDKGAIPSRMVGTHRRALTSDVLAYKQRERAARLQVLDELAAEGQRLKMGY